MTVFTSRSELTHLNELHNLLLNYKWYIKIWKSINYGRLLKVSWEPICKWLGKMRIFVTKNTVSPVYYSW